MGWSNYIVFDSLGVKIEFSRHLKPIDVMGRGFKEEFDSIVDEVSRYSDIHDVEENKDKIDSLINNLGWKTADFFHYFSETGTVYDVIILLGFLSRDISFKVVGESELTEEQKEYTTIPLFD